MVIGNISNISENIVASIVKDEVIAESEHLLSTLKSPLKICQHNQWPHSEKTKHQDQH
jgi:hypothetical protein